MSPGQMEVSWRGLELREGPQLLGSLWGQLRTMSQAGARCFPGKDAKMNLFQREDGAKAGSQRYLPRLHPLQSLFLASAAGRWAADPLPDTGAAAGLPLLGRAFGKVRRKWQNHKATS